MIRSPHNEQLKTLRKLRERRWRAKLGLFAAEGEDLVLAADEAGWEPETLLVAGEDVEAELLHRASALGSGARVVGVYRQRWSAPGGALSVYLHGVADPGNVGAILRSAHALCDGPVALGPNCADPFSPKAVRASMGSLFARPPARARFEELPGAKLALEARAPLTLREAAATAATAMPALVLCLGAERDGLSGDLLRAADLVARIPLREDGPDSLNVAMAATLGLYELANRMAGNA
ncbi:MAG: TrmH family RNA methyltransferase [Nocardioidaceae bacterium]